MKIENIKMKFKDAPVGARFIYPTMSNNDVWVKIHSHQNRGSSDGLGLIVKWNGNVQGYQSRCAFVDREIGISFETIIELV